MASPRSSRSPARCVEAALAAAALTLGGCAAWTPPQTAAIESRAPAGLPSAIELASVPFHPQEPLMCGPAALATVLQQAGLAGEPQALAEQVFLPARGGTLQPEMLAGARRQGAWAVSLPPSLDALLREVAAGHPVVVMQNLGLSFAPMWHYAVLVGYDLSARELVLRSGATRRLVMPMRTFEHTWARSGHWAMLALAPGDLPATLDEAQALPAALAFERVAAPADAARVYAALAARWPGHFVVHMGLGNTRLAAGDLAGAAQAFETAARLGNEAAAWNNLAMVRWQQGDGAAARAALARAEAGANADRPAVAQALRSTRRQVGATPLPMP